MPDCILCDTDLPVIDAYLLIPLTWRSELVLKHTCYRVEDKTSMEVVFGPDSTAKTSTKEKQKQI